MPESKSARPSENTASPDTLTKNAGIALAESELDKVAGGKAKTADKAYQAMDAYIKG